mmetsp:Transcript_8939/g.28381  ORF Transcript_8939/g.28381 Transcript_8939/m.28381 type:complete len:118 (+) Transcript_8939:64-417(+)
MRCFTREESESELRWSAALPFWYRRLFHSCAMAALTWKVAQPWRGQANEPPQVSMVCILFDVIFQFVEHGRRAGWPVADAAVKLCREVRIGGSGASQVGLEAGPLETVVKVVCARDR